tara:strand:- start:217 stop:336 length:120 start_codon:yes stop_codon:yes gene_type:complete
MQTMQWHWFNVSLAEMQAEMNWLIDCFVFTNTFRQTKKK